MQIDRYKICVCVMWWRLRHSVPQSYDGYLCKVWKLSLTTWKPPSTAYQIPLNPTKIYYNLLKQNFEVDLQCLIATSRLISVGELNLGQSLNLRNCSTQDHPQKLTSNGKVIGAWPGWRAEARDQMSLPHTLHFHPASWGSSVKHSASEPSLLWMLFLFEACIFCWITRQAVWLCE